MSKYLTLALTLAIMLFSINGQELLAATIQNDDCDIDVLLDIQDDMGILDQEDLADFLSMVADKNCKKNAEFSEMANELLFQVLVSQPADLFQAMHQLDKASLKNVLKEYAEPVDDAIELQLLINTLKQLNLKDEHKQLVIAQLEKALKKY